MLCLGSHTLELPRNRRIHGLESQGRRCEAVHIFPMKFAWFWNRQDAGVKPRLMVWNLQEDAVKPFAHFSNEIFMVLESSGRCCEGICAILP